MVTSRLRRVNSSNKVGDVDEFERKERLWRPDNPIHAHADSMFSTSSGFNNYRGMLNLCILLLALSNARLFLENIIKYGVLIDPVSLIKYILHHEPQITNLTLLFGINIFILITFATERAIVKKWLSETSSLYIHAFNIIATLIFPACLILTFNPNPAFSALVLAVYSIVFLKIISYVSVNQWCRSDVTILRRKRSKSLSSCALGQSTAIGMNADEVVLYPQNLTLKDLYYFMFAPTLCYELTFPKSPRIRKRFLFKRSIEVLFLLQLMVGLVQQWIIPIINNTMKPLDEMDVSRVVERLLKLAIPNLIIWLMFFYWFFHSCLNVLAELLHFADREFYRDWWNAETVPLFWQNWNVPVHRWASRHLFKPMVRRGYTKMTAAICVFLLSAFFHEYLVSIPLRMFKLWAFSAMLAQIPLAIFVSRYMHGQYGNMAVWLSIIIGQPIAILAYFHDYYITHNMSDMLGQVNKTHTWSVLDLI